ncbi:hypothetical protein CPC08DRAFT_104974 [Agrocybe pediades]|nr:hypothetical protein CPC08DRAFT_104974 [Agrocybe pediades]
MSDASASSAQKQPSSIRFVDYPYPYMPSSIPYMNGSQNHTNNTTTNSCNGNVFKTYNNFYYGRKDTPSRTESFSTEDSTVKDHTRSSEMPDAGAPTERSPTEGDSMSSSSHIQRSNTIKKHKVAPSIGSRRSRYTSAETVMSMSEGECRLVPLPRRQLKFQSPHISRQIEQYMRTDFFGSSFVIPLWRTSQGNISDRVEDRKARVISLGDVGYFDKDAGFCVLFNVYKTFEENLSIGYDPPTCFRHYVPPPGKAISSTLIMRGEEYQPLHGDFKESDWFSDKRDYFLACETPLSKDSMQATALALPDGCIRHHTLVSALATMQDYFNEQAMGWYDYYSSDVHKKDGLVKGSLKLITACYISRTYGAAVFVKEPSKRAEQAFAALCRQRKDEDVYSWERKGAVRTKSGPVPAELVNNKAAYESLCVAVEVTAIKVRKQTFFSDDAPGTMHSFIQSFSSKLHLSKTLSALRITSSVRS